ncbi:nucleotide sugar dehydrogenase [Priestia filamentosa]|uniref:nucleotide sugar dehydrogenase n=1 Tax=Priestia filamentosa TaxID=1402861 RepID=UPI003F1571A4
MKICTIGLGYIGLPTSIMFAKHGAEVIGIDIDPEVVNSLNSGKIHIEEPGLQEALDEVIKKKTFRASLTPERADTFIISVPTPNKDDINKSCDLTYVLAAIKNVIPYLEDGNTVIVESTIAPRSMDDEIKPLIEENGFVIGRDIFLVHCPERVLPGQILHELVFNNRIIGGITPSCTEAGTRIYSLFVKGEIIETNAKTAEMSKLMENTFRDVNIALVNELTKVCTDLDINALDVISMANKHPRVNLHLPGPGVGGHCLAVDPYFIVSKSPQNAKLISLARDINNSMPDFVVENINKLMEMIGGHKVTIFGLTYKGDVDDIRESPALKIFQTLQKQARYEVCAFDPHLDNELVQYDLEIALWNADLAVILVDHSEFKTIDWEKFKSMKRTYIFDTKNILQNIPLEFNYINFGNLYNFIQTEEITL